MNHPSRLARLYLAALASNAVLTASVEAAGTKRILFILDASGSMGAIAADRATRFDHAKEQIRMQAALLKEPNSELGLMVFGHRRGNCDDIEVKLPVSITPTRPEEWIDSSLVGIRPFGLTPLAASIRAASKYIQAQQFGGAEIVIVSDGDDNCGGNAQLEAQTFHAQTGGKITVIGLDIMDRDIGVLDSIARAGGGTFRREFTGAENPSSTQNIGRPTHGREGAPDDNIPIMDYRSVPKELIFAPAPIKPVFSAPPPVPPQISPLQFSPPHTSPPAPRPLPSDAPSELLSDKPMLM